MNHGQLVFAAVDAAPSADYISSMWSSVSRGTHGPIVLLSGSVPEHGVRAADVSGEPARHRGVSARPALHAVLPRSDARDGSIRIIFTYPLVRLIGI